MVITLKGALQQLINSYGYIRSAHVHERASTKSFVVLIIGNSKSNHFGAQGTFKASTSKCVQGKTKLLTSDAGDPAP